MFRGFSDSFPNALTMEDCIEFISRGVDVNSVDIRGNTLLHFAAKYMPTEYIEPLLNLGMNPNLVNHRNETALSILMNRKPFTEEDCISCLLLLNHGADKNTVDCEGNTLLHIVAKKNYLHRYLKGLFEENIDLRIVNADGLTAFSVLQGTYSIEPILTFILEGADPLDFSDTLNYLTGIDQVDFVNRYFSHNNINAEFDVTIQQLLSCMIRGLQACNIRNQEGKNIFQMIDVKYPHLLVEHKHQLTNTQAILEEINLFDLKLELKYASALHNARNEIFNFLILIAKTKQSNVLNASPFNLLPNDLILQIVFFMDLKITNKSLADVAQLMNFIFNNINEMLAMPISKLAGISVFQRGHHQFNFFQSAENICHQYPRYLEQAKREIKEGQKRKNPITDFVFKKEYTNTSLALIEDVKTCSKNAYQQCLDAQMAFYQSCYPKKKLLEATEKTVLGLLKK